MGIMANVDLIYINIDIDIDINVVYENCKIRHMKSTPVVPFVSM